MLLNSSSTKMMITTRICIFSMTFAVIGLGVGANDDWDKLLSSPMWNCVKNEYVVNQSGKTVKLKVLYNTTACEKKTSLDYVYQKAIAAIMNRTFKYAFLVCSYAYEGIQKGNGWNKYSSDIKSTFNLMSSSLEKLNENSRTAFYNCVAELFSISNCIDDNGILVLLESLKTSLIDNVEYPIETPPSCMSSIMPVYKPNQTDMATRKILNFPDKKNNFHGIFLEKKFDVESNFGKLIERISIEYS